jgi:hypothetical protein
MITQTLHTFSFASITSNYSEQRSVLKQSRHAIVNRRHGNFTFVIWVRTSQEQ